jgi:hypothetical protein
MRTVKVRKARMAEPISIVVEDEAENYDNTADDIRDARAIFDAFSDSVPYRTLWQLYVLFDAYGKQEGLSDESIVDP